MSEFDEAYERTVAKVLSEHLERGVPEDTDLWPAVQKRLAEREGPVEQPREHRWFDAWPGESMSWNEQRRGLVTRRVRECWA